MNIAIVGCGYVGLVTGVGLATIGHHVIGVDIATERVTGINHGQPPFYEPNLAERLQHALASGHFRCTSELSDPVAAADVVMLCVETPPRPDGSIDLSSLARATEQIGYAMASVDRYQVVAVRSTVVPGTTQGLVLNTLQQTAASRIAPFGVAANPEFLREGSAIGDFLSPDRIVIGASDNHSGNLLEQLYAPLLAPIIRTNPTTAELIKYASNALLATMISYSNEIANLCEQLDGVDVEDVLSGVRADRRWRAHPEDPDAIVSGIVTYLKAGCGYGGSCLPKDVRALVAFAKQQGYDPQLLSAVDAINHDRPRHLVDVAAEALGGSLQGRQVAVLGLAFKGGTDDLRESPGIAVVQELTRRGAMVIAYDPLVRPEAARRHLNGTPISHADSVADALRAADIGIVTADAPEFRALDMNGSAINNGSRPIIVDGRRILAKEQFASYIGIGWRRSPDLERGPQ